MVVFDPEGNTCTNSPSEGLGVEENPPVGESVVLSKRVGVETAHIGATQAGARVV